MARLRTAPASVIVLMALLVQAVVRLALGSPDSSDVSLVATTLVTLAFVGMLVPRGADAFAIFGFVAFPAATFQLLDAPLALAIPGTILIACGLTWFVYDRPSASESPAPARPRR
jgi:hypothetical protein